MEEGGAGGTPQGGSDLGDVSQRNSHRPCENEIWRESGVRRGWKYLLR